jgi:hypothetical protein
MWSGVTSLLFLSLIWEFGHIQAQSDSMSQDELLASLLGDDVSPPLSEEDGLTILGTGAVDPASTLSCHRRLYSYKVRSCHLYMQSNHALYNVMRAFTITLSYQIVIKFPINFLMVR